MSEAKHTRLDELICNLGGVAGLCDEENEAIWQAIERLKAIPDLLAACKAADQVIALVIKNSEQCDFQGDEYYMLCNVRNQILAAIEKAEGN